MVMCDCKHCLEGIPDVVTNVEVKAISQTQVKVRWIPPVNVNSDPSLLRYRVRSEATYVCIPTHANVHIHIFTCVYTRTHTHTQTQLKNILTMVNFNYVM